MPLQGPAVYLLQGQRVLRIVRVLLMSVRMVVVCWLGWLVSVVLLLLLLLLSFLSLLFTTGSLLVLDIYHSSFHRPLFKTLMYACAYPLISVSAAGPLSVS